VNLLSGLTIKLDTHQGLCYNGPSRGSQRPAEGKAPMFPDRPSQWLVVVVAIVTISVVTHVILFRELSESRRDRRELQDRCDQLVQQISYGAHEETMASVPKAQMTDIPDQELTPVEILGRTSPVGETDRPDQPEPAETPEVNLAMLIDETLPDLDLSDEELAELAGAVTAIQKGMTANRQLERTTENAGAIKSNLEELNASMETFKSITGMDFAAFIRHVDSEGGIDNDRPDDEAVLTEYLRDFEL